MNKIIKAIIVLIAVGVGIGIYMWNKPHRNIAKTTPAHTLSASALIKAFQEDETAANATYLGQVIQVNGAIREISVSEDGTAQILLESQDPMASVSCNLQEGETTKAQELEDGTRVTIKGECSGILMDVVLERCVIVNQQ